MMKEQGYWILGYHIHTDEQEVKRATRLVYARLAKCSIQSRSIRSRACSSVSSTTIISPVAVSVVFGTVTFFVVLGFVVVFAGGSTSISSSCEACVVLACAVFAL